MLFDTPQPQEQYQDQCDEWESNRSLHKKQTTHNKGRKSKLDSIMSLYNTVNGGGRKAKLELRREQEEQAQRDQQQATSSALPPRAPVRVSSLVSL